MIVSASASAPPRRPSGISPLPGNFLTGALFHIYNVLVCSAYLAWKPHWRSCEFVDAWKGCKHLLTVYNRLQYRVGSRTRSLELPSKPLGIVALGIVAFLALLKLALRGETSPPKLATDEIKSQAVWWPLDVSSPPFGKLVALASSSNALVPYVMRGAGSILPMNQMKFRGTYSETGAFLAGPISPTNLWTDTIKCLDGIRRHSLKSL